MTHVHPDELVLSRGGHVTNLQKRGQSVTITTVSFVADAPADVVGGFGAKVAGLGGLPSYAERYWASARR